jgi:FKBP-type peptidyl-prolyl cis-trans isomerase
MKRTAFFSLFLLLLTIILPACKEDEYIDWKLQNEKWMDNLVATHKDDADFHTTSSGLSYKVLHQGEFPKKPNSTSYITATYTGKLIDGSVFDTRTDYPLGYVSGLVPGFQEAVKKMNVSGTYVFYIPSSLGYDTVSTNSQIPPYSNLIFEVNLISAD